MATDHAPLGVRFEAGPANTGAAAIPDRRRVGRCLAALTALVLCAAGLVMASASPAAAADTALASVAPVTAPITTSGLVDCPGGYVCFWVDIHYEGPMGKLWGNNTNWSVFSQDKCANKNWDNCASSTFNNGNDCAVTLYRDPGYGGTFLWEQRGSVRYNLKNNRDQYGHSFNDAFSSNKWC
jgi:hypothetical protein